MHALACLSALLAASMPVDVPLGGEPLALEIAVEVRTEAGTSSPGLAWRTRGDGAVEGRGAGPGYEARIALAPAAGGARTLEAAIRWTAPVSLERAAVRLAWRGGTANALGRDLAYGKVAGPRRTGRGTPLLVSAGRVVLAGGPGLASARIEPARGGVAVTLFLDDAEERPFSTYASCLDHLPASERSRSIRWNELEVRRPVRGSPRGPGDADALGATLYPLAPGGRFLPVVVERWPAGARAAVVLTDHADRTDAAALRAVLWGSSDPRASGGVGAGLLGRGLKITRTFFAHANGGGALDDPEVRLVADDLAVCGSEVALHSITPDRDGRDAVQAGLASAAAWRPATWIDHEPYTNCEAIASRGAGDGPWGIRDLLERAGVRWVWAAGDVDGRAGTRIVNVLGGDPAQARPAIFPLPNDPRLWAFRSSMFYASPAELAAALSGKALAALEAERGLFVAHTYLGPSSATTHAEAHLARLAVVSAAGGLAIHPALDAAFARIAARVRAGRLASLAWVEAGDRLRALGDVEVAYRPDGAAEVRNEGAADLRALTVTLPAAGLQISLEGAALLGREDADGWARLWFDLPAGEHAILRASDDLVPVAILPFR